MTSLASSLPTETPSPANFPDSPPNILIVDDRRENLIATETVLRTLNCRIFKASSGNEALTFLLNHRFAVILLDVQMPEMDGFETAMLMQEHENMKGAPIIFISGISKEEKYASQAAEIGAVDYIFKPVNPDILKSKVKVYLDIYVQREHILKLNHILQQSNEELERFAYICSHDMQEPVRMMNGYAKILQDSLNELPDDTREKYLHFITSSAQHLQKMIQDILTFSRVGREEIKPEIVDCNTIIQGVLGEFETIITQTNAHITCDRLPVIETNPTLMRILFQNLIGNALKFQDGKKPPEICIRAEEKNNTWQFSIHDNGIGINPMFNDKVFAIFQRLHRREEYPGTGIGLSTCKKFIELYHGEIWFKSQPGMTQFFFTLPKESTAPRV